MKRRHMLRALGALPLAALIPSLAWAAATTLPAVQVFKNAQCGCCGAWVDHMRAAGFTVNVTEVDDTAVARKRHGIPDRLGSCHTATVGGYALEGHVPAAEVKRLLAQKPDAVGLAVPGMPVGSPGMEVGNRQDPYQVVLVGRNGRDSVFASYPKGRPAS